MRDLSVIEGTAEALYRSAGEDVEEPGRVLPLAKRLLGATAVKHVDARALPGDASLARVGSEVRVYVRKGLSRERLEFALAHELAHWALEVGSGSAEEEAICDAVAAALVVPRAAFRRALVGVGDRYHELAGWFGTTESCVALRFGEVTRTPTALVAPLSVRVRGDAFVWPGERELRNLAKAKRSPGLRKATLRDDRRRVAMRVAG
jgi:hypothetical protein